jgi:hypothetical protein
MEHLVGKYQEQKQCIRELQTYIEELETAAKQRAKTL